MINIAIFASGAGSNAEVIIKTLFEFEKSKGFEIALIVSNKPEAGVIDIARMHHIPVELLNFSGKSDEDISADYLHILSLYKIDFIILAGYLKKIPGEVINKFQQKIVNIHPALLPNYGGAGMYGMHVHMAVIAAGEKESGITVHYIDEIYDHGQIIFQASCIVEKDETAESLAKKIHLLEHQHYSHQISKILLSQFPVK